MEHHERATFNRADEVIEQGIAHLRRVGEALERLAGLDHGERVRLLLTSVEVEQRNLLGSLERLLEDLPDKVAETYAQYTVELPHTVELPETPVTTLSLTQWLEQQNGALRDTFAELADKVGGDAGEIFAGIAEQVDAHDRRLSKEYQRTEDL